MVEGSFITLLYRILKAISSLRVDTGPMLLTLS
jgi:hypothetical protein